MKTLKNITEETKDPIVVKIDHNVHRICLNPGEEKTFHYDDVADYILENYTGIELIEESMELSEEPEVDKEAMKLEFLKKDDLIRLAKARQIELKGNEKKADLIEFLSK